MERLCDSPKLYLRPDPVELLAAATENGVLEDLRGIAERAFPEERSHVALTRLVRQLSCDRKISAEVEMPFPDDGRSALAFLQTFKSYLKRRANELSNGDDGWYRALDEYASRIREKITV